jgi:SAM-dependent methyltransferase
MDPRLQRRVQRYGWDKACDHYEQYWSQQLLPAQIRLLEMADLQPGERVVDIACGTGLVTFPAAEAVGSTGRVVGTDISESMVKLVRDEAKQREIGHAQFERMDAEDLRYPDCSFDAALSALGLMYVPDALKAVHEMFRLLKPGGRAVAAVWGGRSQCGWAEIFPIVDSRVQSEVCPLFFQLGTGDTLQRTFDAAGFVSSKADRLSAPLHYESANDALGAAFAGGPVALAYSRFDEETREEAHSEYLGSIEPFRNGDGYKIPGEFVVVSGRRSDSL